MRDLDVFSYLYLLSLGLNFINWNKNFLLSNAGKVGRIGIRRRSNCS